MNLCFTSLTLGTLVLLPAVGQFYQNTTCPVMM